MRQFPKTSTLKVVTPHFQRSINLTYDAGNADYIAGYIPTPNGAKALAAILDNTAAGKNQRAHVLHAAYGSGKSLLAVVLSTQISRDPLAQSALEIVLDRLRRAFPAEAERVRAFQSGGCRLLPVLLSGDEGPLNLALARALRQTLHQSGLGDLRPRTQFQAALDMITLWQQSYPEVYLRLDERLVQEGLSLPDLQRGLDALEPPPLALFERLYPDLTAGAHFDGYARQSLTEALHATAEALHDAHFDGLVIIWDEFGRYLEAKVGEAFGREAALLQSLAEFCQRSGPHQVHLVLTTHRLLSGYAAELPLTYRQEWARIADRFQTHDVTSDPLVTYRLIAEALTTPDPIAWSQFAEQHQASFTDLTARSLELALFEDLDDVALRQQIIERVWPLHPLTVYALPRLASRVAQNERTLFTFLAADDPGALTSYLARLKDGWGLLKLDQVWDYFAEAIRADMGPGGTHAVWSGVMYALSKAPADDGLTISLVKTLGILLIVGDVNVQWEANLGQVVSTTELLAWGLTVGEGEIAARLEILARRRAVVFRQADGFWTFTRGSDIDLDSEIAIAIERRAPSRSQIRQLLERDAPLPFHLPRSYNQQKGMTRFCWGLYRWPDQLKGVNDTFLKQLGPAGYADGAVVYVLATNQAEIEEAIATLQSLPSERVVYVVPKQPLLVTEPVRELFALRDLSNDATFMAQDERLSREVSFFIEDTQRRLWRALRPLHDPAGASWWWPDGTTWRKEHIQTEADISRLLSRLCQRWFAQTPVLKNELLNQQEPSPQQVRAAEKVIDALLSYPRDQLPANLGLVGYGPDYLIFRTILVSSGLLQAVIGSEKHEVESQVSLSESDSDTEAVHPTPSLEETGEETGESWRLVRPGDEHLGQIWDKVQEFLDLAVENEREVVQLIEQLQSPPYGLRRGVLPILLAAMLRPRLHILTVRQNRKPISPLTGQTLTELCRKPEQFTLAVGPWDDRRAALWEVLQDRLMSLAGVHEQERQPLSYLSLALLRWLQAQPRFCRDTHQLSAPARQFRDLIRQAQRDPAQVLLHDLLELLEQGDQSDSDSDRGSISLLTPRPSESEQPPPPTSHQMAYRQTLAHRLNHLMDEISTAYQALLHHLDTFAESHFAPAALIPRRDGYAALNYWLTQVEQQTGHPLNTFRFSDALAQRVVEAIRSDQNETHFWDRLSDAIIGIRLYDWNDRSIETFKSNLLEAKDRLEREIFELAEDEAVIELNVAIPGEAEQTYRFRPSDLSPHGQHVLQNFISTLDIAGRPLSPDERRQVVLALLHHIMEGPKSDDKRGRKKPRTP